MMHAIKYVGEAFRPQLTKVQNIQALCSQSNLLTHFNLDACSPIVPNCNGFVITCSYEILF